MILKNAEVFFSILFRDFFWGVPGFLPYSPEHDEELTHTGKYFGVDRQDTFSEAGFDTNTSGNENSS